jgi:membrane protein DedA with SNARE-associated domain
MPFRRFAVSVVLATLIWTTLLFGAAYVFGAATADLLGAWRWLGALVPAVILFAIGRVRARRAYELPIGPS